MPPRKEKAATNQRSAITKPIGQFVGAITRRSFGKHGFDSATIILEWPQIIGPDLAGQCFPERISFPKGQRSAGILTICTQGPLALQLQHLKTVLIDRINSYVGYAMIADIRLRQQASAFQQRAASSTPPASTTAPVKPPPADLPSESPSYAAIEAIEDAELRDCLIRLYRGLQGRQRRA